MAQEHETKILPVCHIEAACYTYKMTSTSVEASVVTQTHRLTMILVHGH